MILLINVHNMYEFIIIIIGFVKFGFLYSSKKSILIKII